MTGAKTGTLINGFRAVPVIYFRPDFLYVNRRDAIDGRAGRFAIEFDRTDIEHGLRIEAEGYRTQRFGPWKIGVPNVALNVKLEPAAPLRGVVVDGEGQPVSRANVYLATHTQHLDIANRQDDEDAFLHKTDAQGRFTFPT